jgi:hypothetical protein
MKHATGREGFAGIEEEIEIRLYALNNTLVLSSFFRHGGKYSLRVTPRI